MRSVFRVIGIYDFDSNSNQHQHNTEIKKRHGYHDASSQLFFEAIQSAKSTCRLGLPGFFYIGASES